MLKSGCCALALVVAASGGAFAQAIDGADPAAVEQAARGFGSARLETDNVGDPKISGRINGIAYTIYFYGCEDNENCDTVMFRTAWDHDGVGLDRINEWNRDKLFGKAYHDAENDPALELAVNLEHGVDPRNFEDTIEIWRITMEAFEDFIGFER